LFITSTPGRTNSRVIHALALTDSLISEKLWTSVGFSARKFLTKNYVEHKYISI
jgi:hypothetical protein